jgi:hypothetical protein
VVTCFIGPSGDVQLGDGDALGVALGVALTGAEGRTVAGAMTAPGELGGAAAADGGGGCAGLAAVQAAAHTAVVRSASSVASARQGTVAVAGMADIFAHVS